MSTIEEKRDYPFTIFIAQKNRESILLDDPRSNSQESMLTLSLF